MKIGFVAARIDVVLSRKDAIFSINERILFAYLEKQPKSKQEMPGF